MAWKHTVIGRILD